MALPRLSCRVVNLLLAVWAVFARASVCLDVCLSHRCGTRACLGCVVSSNESLVLFAGTWPHVLVTAQSANQVGDVRSSSATCRLPRAQGVHAALGAPAGRLHARALVHSGTRSSPRTPAIKMGDLIVDAASLALGDVLARNTCGIVHSAVINDTTKADAQVGCTLQAVSACVPDRAFVPGVRGLRLRVCVCGIQICFLLCMLCGCYS